MIKTCLKKITSALILVLAFSSGNAMAQIFKGSEEEGKSDTQAGTEAIKEALGGSGVTAEGDIGNLVLKYVNFALPYLALAAFAGFVYAGFLYVTAYGSDDQIQKSKKILIYAVAGLVLVILSYSIVQLLTGELVEGIAR